MGHALSKKAIVHLKMATVRFDMNTAVFLLKSAVTVSAIVILMKEEDIWLQIQISFAQGLLCHLHSSEATVTPVPVWKRGISKQGMLKGKMNSRLLQNSRLPKDRTIVYQKIELLGGTELSSTHEFQTTELSSTTELSTTRGVQNSRLPLNSCLPAILEGTELLSTLEFFI